DRSRRDRKRRNLEGGERLGVSTRASLPTLLSRSCTRTSPCGAAQPPGGPPSHRRCPDGPGRPPSERRPPLSHRGHRGHRELPPSTQTAPRARRFACAPLLGAALLLVAPSVIADVSGSATPEDPFGGRPRPAEPPPRGDRAGAFDQATVDGVYGRFDGDLSLAVGLGGELGFDPASPRLLGTLALRYYSLVGLYAGYRESLRDVDPQARGLSVGLLLEPLFLLRWTRAATTGSPFWDLTIDSL